MKKEKAIEVATNYAEIAKQIAELTKKADVYKEQLVEYAQEHEITEMVDLGAVSVYPKTTNKATLDVAKCKDLPNWIYRMQANDLNLCFSLKPEQRNIAKSKNPNLGALLDEVGYTVESNVAYAVKLNA